jgi:hypothetical protein
MKNYRREYSSRLLTLRSGTGIVRANLMQAAALDSLSPPLPPPRPPVTRRVRHPHAERPGPFDRQTGTLSIGIPLTIT